jgi:pyruvate/2-oxoglutarate dehydrogenase complex dihydrolipoamide acyltransferase (E2) component
MDVESFDEGYLSYILTGEGQVAGIGHAVGLLADAPTSIERVAAFGKVLQEAGGDMSAVGTVVVSGTTEITSEMSATVPHHTGGSASTARPLLSGYAKSVAHAHKIDPSALTSSRADGVISSKDVFGAINKQSVTQTSSQKHSQASTYVSPPGVVNASPMARRAAVELKVDISKVTGTGNFNRVTEDDVLIFAGKKPKHSGHSDALPKPLPLPANARPDASLPSTQGQKPSATGPPTLAEMGDKYVSMDGMQKAVVKNMEKSLSVPVFRVSRCIYHNPL